jgi:hypothetical protein
VVGVGGWEDPLSYIEGFAEHVEREIPGDVVSDEATDIVVSYQTFTSNKHTLVDIIDWLKRKANVHVWLTPTPDGLSLVASQDPHTVKHTAHNLGGDLMVVTNDALAELRPVNTQVVAGRAMKSHQSVNPFNRESAVKIYAEVKARHTELYERAGQREYHAARKHKSDAMTKKEVENEAKRILKERIQSATGGDMTTLLRGPITPFDTVEALPACTDGIAGDQPTTYQVSRVHHHIPGSGIAETTLNVGIHVDEGDIEVDSSWVDITQSGDPSDKLFSEDDG